MAKIQNLATISTEFDIDECLLAELGIIDTQLTTDTNLFIDPLLLSESEHDEIRIGAANSYEQRFEFIIKLLVASKEVGDVPWRTVEKLFNFSEISWTCLGYSSSVRGAGFGKELKAVALDTAAQIVRLGVTDADFFMGLSLFEEGIGPDRISDMTTNIILNDLVIFTQRVNASLKIPEQEFKVNKKPTMLPKNPYTSDPLIFVPRDIVRDLPIATDWSDISRVVRENDELRERVNEKVGSIWAKMTKKDKLKLKSAALDSKESFEQVMKMLREVPLTSYNFTSDENGETFWASLIKTVAQEYPLIIDRPSKPMDISSALEIVDKIIKQFQTLVEDNGIWKELWTEEKRPRKEKAAQRLFFVVAHAYCKANNLDLTPEADSGNGPVDFKFSSGFECRIVVEIKLSTNSSLVHGYERQLEIYKTAEETRHGIYLVIDVGYLRNKYGDIQKKRREAIDRGANTSAIYYIDGNVRDSASKRK
ncbi:hypothetical protein SAMN05444506_12859 [Pseudomonas syringae]|uniref:Uncharacterized protein n=1 Tax=Pseudomonas syringae pv. apii TaxID=81036 RepID=A0A3M3MPA0_9PSED|nr:MULTISPECIES: hypothetical protein [Pseudomonas syringae group]RMN49171.1 hypothetical protein ALQ59_00520 [Pseudomonas syringae pv. apii]RMN55323.1 hypothetical protein ALQ58_200297 [Pseudomonas syringae pv. apii]RMN95107.1 hypothetical protein ALQ49_03488 [Pseudomonas syringae pv. apii]SDZ57795.1 hypothetical protein SAMN05444506_12859 [Pseudomonas syringae]